MLYQERVVRILRFVEAMKKKVKEPRKAISTKYLLTLSDGLEPALH